jgi:hypothetical protein
VLAVHECPRRTARDLPIGHAAGTTGPGALTLSLPSGQGGHWRSVPQASRPMQVSCPLVGAMLLLHFAAARHSPLAFNPIAATRQISARRRLPDTTPSQIRQAYGLSSRSQVMVRAADLQWDRPRIASASYSCQATGCGVLP